MRGLVSIHGAHLENLGEFEPCDHDKLERSLTRVWRPVARDAGVDFSANTEIVDER